MPRQLLVCCALVLHCASALSSGPKTCDAISLCDEDGVCPEGMHLVGPPVRSSTYLVETEAASYTPGKLVTLTVRVVQPTIQGTRNAGKLQCLCTGKKCPAPYCDCGDTGKCCGSKNKCTLTAEPFLEGSKYIGLLLYAVRTNDPGETKVGSWELPVQSSPPFMAMGGPSCEGKALVQTSATLKRYTERFWFRGPAQGTGSITFRVLLKQGDTNGGNFYWPSAGNGNAPPSNGVAGGDLTLTEAPLPVAPLVQWVRGTAGLTCDQVCTVAGRACDPSRYSDARGADGLLSAIGDLYLCAPPLLSSCDPFAPSATGYGDGWCWYADPTRCPAAGASECSATPPGPETGLRFCPCTLAGAQRHLKGALDNELEQPVAAVKHEASPQNTPGGTGCPFAEAAAAAHARGGGGESASGCPKAGWSSERRAHRVLAAAPAAMASPPIEAMQASPWRLMAHIALPLTGIAFVALTVGRRTCGHQLARKLATTTRLLMALDGAGAHNWINSPRSRATKASTVSPCLPRDGPMHVRVNPGQEFLIEWASGHPGSYHYLVVLKATDEAKMAQHSEQLMDDYLASAPAGTTLEGVRYRKLHYGWTGKTRAGGDEPKHTNFLSQGLTEVTSADADEFVARPEAFACANYGSVQGSWSKPTPPCVQVADLTLYRYPEAAHTEDVRAAYANEKYPWIEAVHKFKAFKPTPDKNGFPKQFDTARFSIPARGGAGEYIVQYYWRGYRDCIDVGVLPATVPVGTSSQAIYGGLAVTGGSGDGGGGNNGDAAVIVTMTKTDHCQYSMSRGQLYDRRDSLPGTQVCQSVPPPGETNSQGQTRQLALDKCLERCKTAEQCDAVNVVPAEPPAATVFKTAAVHNVPWGDETGCNQQAVLANEPLGTSICYGLAVVEERELDVGEAYTIVDNDPQDEVFYSTCYKKTSGFSFGSSAGNSPSPAPPAPPLRWRFGEHCLSCNGARIAQSTGYWVLSDTCEMCSRDDLPPLPPGLNISDDVLPPNSPPATPARVRVAFSASGDPSEFDAPTRQAIKAVIAGHANVPIHAVGVEVTSGSVIVTVTIAVASEVAASTTARNLADGVLCLGP